VGWVNGLLVASYDRKKPVNEHFKAYGPISLYAHFFDTSHIYMSLLRSLGQCHSGPACFQWSVVQENKKDTCSID